MSHPERPSIRLLVCGGRLYEDVETLRDALDAVHARENVRVVLHGGAIGADELAGMWAAGRGIKVAVFRAEWTTYGRAAGPRRNQVMIDHGRPDLVVAFPGGPGTADMVRRAEAAGVRVELAGA